MNETRLVSSPCSTTLAQHPRQSRRLRQLALLLPVLVGMQGCASLTHYNAVRDLDGAPGARSEAILMDAKQRGVYTITTAEKDANGNVIKSFQHFCAEPSPDALSNLAAQFGATVNIDAKGEGAINGGFAEGAANIGLRTTSIQILRDITYRQCEAYANGGISRLGLETLQRRFQSTMVALLSIEQLTGAVRAPAVVLAGKAAGADAELIVTLTEKTVAARTAVTKSESEVTDKDKAATDKAAAAKKLKDDFDTEKASIDALRKSNPAAGTSDKKKIDDFDAAKAAKEKAIADADTDSAKAVSEVAAAKKTLGDRKETLEAMSAALTAARAAGGQASTSGEIRPIVVPSALDADSTKAVAEAVTNIVRDTLSLGFGREVCTSIIGDQTDPTRAHGNSAVATKASETVLGACVELLREDITYYKSLEGSLDSHSALTDSIAGLVDRCTNDPKCVLAPEKMIQLIEALQPPRTGPAPFSTPFSFVKPSGK